MDSLNRVVFPLRTAETGTRHGKTARRDNGLSVVRPSHVTNPTSDALKTADGLKIAGLALAGLALITVAGIYAYRKHLRTKPLTRLQHLKAQLGLSNADFRDLKANLTKLNADQLKELNKAAW